MLDAILASFVLGLLTPLTAVCVLPLYPGFLAYLANQREGKKYYAVFGLLITLGVILFMLLIGIIFTTVLQFSLTNVIGIVSPIAFSIMAVISLLLIFDIEWGRFLPTIRGPTSKNPVFSALLYGFFFGAIVIPCNPGFISVFFARSLLFGNFLSSISNFLSFGFGLGFPLLLFSLISANWSQHIIGFMIKHKRKVNLIAGILMLLVSLYYLTCTFNIFGEVCMLV